MGWIIFRRFTLGYTSISITELIGDEKSKQLNMADIPVEKVAEYAAEDADVTWQLREKMEPLAEGKRAGAGVLRN